MLESPKLGGFHRRTYFLTLPGPESVRPYQVIGFSHGLPPWLAVGCVYAQSFSCVPATLASVYCVQISSSLEDASQ